MLKYHATIKILFLKKNILENAYNCKKKHPLQIEWDTNFVGKISYTTEKIYQAWKGLPMFSIVC